MDFSDDDDTGTCLIALKHQTCIIFAIDSLGTPFDGSGGVSSLKLRELSYGSKPLYCLLAGGRKTLEDAVIHVQKEHSKSQYSDGSRMTVAATAKCAADFWSPVKKYRQPERRSCLVVGAYDGGQLELWAAINGIEGSEAQRIDVDAYLAGSDSDAAWPFFSTYTRETDFNTAIRWIEEGMVAASERPKSQTGGVIKILKILPNNQMEMIGSNDVAILKAERDARLKAERDARLKA